MSNARQADKVPPAAGGSVRIGLEGKHLFQVYMLLLVVFSCMAGGIFFVLRADTDAAVRDLIMERSSAASRALNVYIQELQNRALRRVEFLSGSSALSSALARNDYESVRRLVEERAKGMDSVWITDADGVRLAHHGNFMISPISRLSIRDTGAPQVGIYEAAGNSLFILAVAPVFDGERRVGKVFAAVNLANREILTPFKDSHGTEVTIFAGPVRINSTLLRTQDSYVIGTVADKKIITSVLESKQSYFGRVSVNGRTYQGLYSPILSEGKAIGIFYTGVDVHSILERQASIRNFVFILVGIIVCLIGLAFAILRHYGKLYFIKVDELSRATDLLNKQKNLLNSIDSYIYVTDTEDRRILFVNKNLMEHFPLDDSAIGKHCWSVFFPDRKEPCENCTLPSILANPQKEEIRETYHPLTGRYYRHVDRLIDWSDGRKVFLCQRIDVTQARQALEKAERAGRIKSQFLSRMSHEMRTPLNAILGMAQIAVKQEGSEPVRDSLKKIGDSAEYLLGIVNDILDIGALESGELRLDESKFLLQELLDQVHAVVALKMRDKDHNFTISVAENVPQIFVSDKSRLAQVFTHLLHNACKFTPKGGTIALRISRMDGFDEAPDFCTLLIEVEDNGIGIDEDKGLLIFKAFEQADNSITRKHGGLGLGLTISRHIILAMNGELWIKKGKERGIIFAFSICTKFVSGETEPPSLEARPQAPKRIFAEKSLLLVDDVVINREIVIALLEETGIAIDCASNGREACEKFAANYESYDLIILDIHMPEMNGYEASAAIRQMGLPNSKTIPIIAMTADVFTHDIEKYLDAGMNECLGKPVNIDALMDMLKRALLA